MTRIKLNDSDILERLKGLGGWELVNKKLHRELGFNNFVEAFGFMTKAALISEKLDHHPEWFNVYNKIVIDLSTHDAGGVTDLDFKWASEIDLILNSKN